MRTSHAASVDEQPIDRMFSYYPSWHKLKKAVAWLLRFKSILRFGRKHISTPYLSTKEIREAEVAVIRFVQNENYAPDLLKLKKSETVASSSSIALLSPVINAQGLLSVGGRIKHAAVDLVAKHPILIPHGHPIARLIALDSHNIAHLGVEWIVSIMIIIIREKFWITKIRRAVKSVSHSCVTCRKLFAPPNVQIMADLLAERLHFGDPLFTFVGMDCFGPCKVKVGRSEIKRYGCVFTCLTSRAVHIEMLSSLDSDSFINGIRRFIARGGIPAKLWSDNGTNFVGAQSELSRDLKYCDEE